MNKKNNSGIAVGLVLIAALIVGLFFYFTRVKRPTADTAQPEESQVTETVTEQTEPGNDETIGTDTGTADGTDEEDTSFVHLTDNGEIVVEVSEDEETFGE